METTNPKKTCGAKNRRGDPCQKSPLAGRTRCANHGGKSLRGPDSPNWKTGRYSRALPEKLLSRFEASMTDPDLLALAREISLLDTLLEELVTDATDWGSIADLVERRRRLVESERKRLAEMNQTLTVTEAVALASKLIDITRRYVTDQSVLAAIGREITALLDRDVPAER
jgi:hypothetical protein